MLMNTNVVVREAVVAKRKLEEPGTCRSNKQEVALMQVVLFTLYCQVLS